MKNPTILIAEGDEALRHNLKRRLISHDFGDLHGFGNDQAEVLLNKGLKLLGKTEQDLKSDLKMAPWKITLACWIKVQCGVNNRWFSDNMNMGVVCNISKVIALESKKAN